jgi:phage gp29-like protein
MALLDAYGRPMQRAQMTKTQVEGGMTSVRQVWHDTAASGLTPVRLANILRDCDLGSSRDFLTLAEEMEERDMHYGALLGIRKRAVSGVRPTVKAVADDAKSKEIAEAVERDIARHTGFRALVKDLLDSIGKSYAAVEIEWSMSASRWKPRRFIYRDPRFFTFGDDQEELRLLTVAAPVKGEELWPGKWAVHRSSAKSGLTRRGGLARLVAFGWMCKGYTLKDWMAFVETYGLPLRLGRYGPEATKQDVEALFRAVANIGTDAAAVLPKSMEIEFVKGIALQGTDVVFQSLARWVDEQVSKAVLGQTMSTDNGSSQSQATVHNEVRHDIAQDDALDVAATINRDIVKPYVDWNWGQQDEYPELRIEIAEPEDIKVKIDGAAQLMDRGVKFRATELRGKLGFSDPEEGDEIVGGQPAPVPGTPPAQNRVSVAMNRAQEGSEGDLDEIEADMMSDWEEVSGEMEAAIRAVVDEAEDYEDLLARLPEALKRMPTAVLVETLVKGMFQARAVGDDRDG